MVKYLVYVYLLMNMSADVETIFGIKISDRDLEKSIQKYYSLESEKNWKETYKLRTFKYKQTVDFELYRKKMEDGGVNWSLKKIEIMSFKLNNTDSASVIIRFTSVRNSKLYRFIEETDWIKTRDKWEVLKPGVRGIFPLNDFVVY